MGLVVAGVRPQSTCTVAVTYGLSCPVACGIFLHQGLNLRPLHWTNREVPAWVLGKRLWPYPGLEWVGCGSYRPGGRKAWVLPPNPPTPESSRLSFLEHGVVTAGQLWHLPEGSRTAPPPSSNSTSVPRNPIAELSS